MLLPAIRSLQIGLKLNYWALLLYLCSTEGGVGSVKLGPCGPPDQNRENIQAASPDLDLAGWTAGWCHVELSARLLEAALAGNGRQDAAS